MEPYRTRPETELKESLRKHLGFLRRSAEWYDAGQDAEAERLAVSLRVLFHTTKSGSSTSLLHLLQMEDVMLLSTTDEGKSLIKLEVLADPKRLHTFPLLGSANPDRELPFQDWWEEELEVVVPLGLSGSRKSFVLSLANRDGAHVDPELTAEDQLFRTIGDLRIRVDRQIEGFEPAIGKEFTVHNALHASVRQIAYEVLESPVFDPFRYECR